MRDRHSSGQDGRRILFHRVLTRSRQRASSLGILVSKTLIILITNNPYYKVGNIMLIGQVWDAIAHPIVGKLSDHTKSRWGRRRVNYYIGDAIVISELSLIHYLAVDLVVSDSVRSCLFCFVASSANRKQNTSILVLFICANGIEHIRYVVIVAIERNASWI